MKNKNYNLPKELVKQAIAYNYKNDILKGGYYNVNVTRVKEVVLRALENLMALPPIKSIDLENKALFDAFKGVKLTIDEVDLLLDNTLLSKHFITCAS